VAIAYNEIIVACWCAFIIYWFVAALGAKPSVGAHALRRVRFLRIGAIIVVLFLVRFLVAEHGSHRLADGAIAFGNPSLELLGVALCLAGMALAVWARIYLGSNWGMPMTFKENPELVTTGPYGWVRHPIYTGFLLAMFGSALVGGISWFIWLVFTSAYFTYSATTEERMMEAQFPNIYPGYKQRTKMLIPFLL
jgi:protein-S-isoprenylcysteine O-methyltransferase Ste14